MSYTAKAAIKAKKGLIALNREYLMIGVQLDDEEYMIAFNAMIKVLERLEVFE